LQFDGYTYDWLFGKLVEVLITIFHTFSHVQVGNVVTSSQNELVVITTEEFKLIKRGAKLVIISYKSLCL
jgi:hypothetical protein